MEEFIEQIGEMILESVPALAVLTFMISDIWLQQHFKDGV